LFHHIILINQYFELNVLNCISMTNFKKLLLEKDKIASKSNRNYSRKC
jgi:hypothetical protein